MSLSEWQKDQSVEPDISVIYSPLSSTSTSPHIDGTISNKSLQNIGGLELIALVQDNNENAIAVSRTFIDGLNKASSQDFVFTWPKPFDTGVESCISPLDISLALDRSDSMQNEQINPPEPFSTVKSTAQDFIKNLSNDDRVAVISFGTDVTVDSSLSANKQKALTAINTLSLGTTSGQTNIVDGLLYSSKELSLNVKGGRKQSIIMLTDGIPTEPQKMGDLKYPEEYALSIQNGIASTSEELYVIGLGKEVSESFLKSLVVDSSHYFLAPTKKDLSSIYKSISSSLCVKRPSVINIMYRILPNK